MHESIVLIRMYKGAVKVNAFLLPMLGTKVLVSIRISVSKNTIIFKIKLKFEIDIRETTLISLNVDL